MYLADEHKIWVCKGEDKICMLPKMANRHGLIAGATGYGQDRYFKGAGRILQRDGRAGIPGRYQRRRFRYVQGW